MDYMNYMDGMDGMDSLNVDGRREEAGRDLWRRFRRMEAEVNQIEVDTLAYNDLHPDEPPINPDVSLLRKQLEIIKEKLPKEFMEEGGES